MRSNPSHPVVIQALACAPQPSFIRSLRDRPVRDRHGLFVAEGARFLCTATDSEIPIAGLITCPQLVQSETARSLIRTLRQEGLPSTVVRPEVLRELSVGVDSQGILLVLKQNWQPLPETLDDQDLWVGLETLRSPGNFGTLLRSADAAGGTGVVIFDRSEAGSRGGVDPYDPLCVRATMGSLFRHRFMRTTHRAFRFWNARRNLNVIGATGEARADFRDLEYRQPTMIMLGDERDGLSPGQRNSTDIEAKIPMAGTPDSLNVAMAGTLMLYEAFRQRDLQVREQARALPY